MTNEFIFILGQAQELAAYELEQILKLRIVFSSFIVEKNLGFIKSEAEPEKIAGLIKVLGGTIKIGQLVGAGEWFEIVKKDLLKRPVRDVGLSFYSSHSKDLWTLKSDLLDQGIKIRLVLAKQDGVLNEAEIRSNKLVGKGREYLVAGEKVYETLAAQQVEKFVERDYGKPKNNAYSGMLPPKLARMMVNLATEVAQNQISKIKNQKFGELDQLEIRSIRPSLTVVDPFCGSGNILLEALDLGYEVAGSDISKKAVEWTRENVEWFENQRSQIPNPKYQNNCHSGLDPESIQSVNSRLRGNDKATDSPSNVFKADATKDDFLKGIEGSCVVVSEPFLGVPKKGKITRKQAGQELDKLAEMYLGFLRNLKRICHSRLSPCHPCEGRDPLIDRVDSRLRGNDRKRIESIHICLVFPTYETFDRGKVGLYDRIVDKIASLGYIKLAGPFTYGRDHQVVKREIVLLRLPA